MSYGFWNSTENILGKVIMLILVLSVIFSIWMLKEGGPWGAVIIVVAFFYYVLPALIVTGLAHAGASYMKERAQKNGDV